MADLTPQAFVEKWKKSELKERASAQEHFLDLCRMLRQPSPAEADPTGEFFTFEKSVQKIGGDVSGSQEGRGAADVWFRNHFAWEYKGKHKDLAAAYRQLLLYRIDLGSPPLLVVCDIDRYEIHTAFDRSVEKVYRFTNSEIANPNNLALLKAMFEDPDSLRPERTREGVTEQVAEKFATVADGLRSRGENPQQVAHFLNQVLFAMFAEDIRLLPEGLFTKLLEGCRKKPERFASRAHELFSKMANGGDYGADEIAYFNGGLFAEPNALPLTAKEIGILLEAARLDWGSVEPAIFGTLFERSLDPERRSQLGAQYTRREDVMDVVQPVLMAPLQREWERVKVEATELAAGQGGGSAATARGAAAAALTRQSAQARRQAQEKIDAFREKLKNIRILDPACGSGNFLSVSLRELLELEREVRATAGELGGGALLEPEVSPNQLYGVELDPYARELCQVSLWIGYLQWWAENRLGRPAEPVLGPMENILTMDAILDHDEEGHPRPSEPSWPEADVIVGNPPFLGSRRMRPVLGDEYCEALLQLYKNRVDGLPDLVCYWFERSRELLEQGKVDRVGLIATQAIRNRYNRKVLERIKGTGDIFMAHSDRPWILDGAAVRVSMVGFDDGTEPEKVLDGRQVQAISTRLTDETQSGDADRLPENRGVDGHGLSFQGVVLWGPFTMDAATANRMLSTGGNPNGRPNSDVLRPRYNANDLTKRPSDTYVVDFGVDMPENQAALYEEPYEYLRNHVYPFRQEVSQKKAREFWWIHWNPREDMRKAISPLSRYIATPRVGKHRIFSWVPVEVLPDTRLVVFSREDDYFFGILHSRAHELWALDMSARHGVGNDPTYNNRDCFETFPLPWPPGTEPEEHPLLNAVAQAAQELNEQRDRWLSAEGLSESQKKKRTLSALYNEKPSWLRMAHKELDRAVYAAYGWSVDVPEGEMLENLFELNKVRANGAQ